jgi:hypothetical protein
MIDEIVILSLKNREDRRTRCREILDRCGLEYRFYLTEKDDSRLYERAGEDFVKMLSTIEGVGLVFEDDFELTKDWEDVLQKAYKELPRDYDLLYLGGNLTESAEKITSNLVKLNGAWCAHAIVYSKKFINFVIKNYRFETCGVYDDWLRRIAPKRKFYMTYPMVSWQRASYSDFQNQNVSYNLFINQHYIQL